MAVRALVNMPRSARRGEVIEIRTLLAHPMETGYRADSEGRVLARDIVRRFECRFDGELVFAADLYPAIAANPYLAFHTVALASGTITLRWSGDNRFEHLESVALAVA